MPETIATIRNVPIRSVWPKEDQHFTPWLQEHIGELDSVLGIGLTNAQREVGAGSLSIDLMAETDFGDVVIENQFGTSDHRHLGQLVTYVSHRDVKRAIWIAEYARPEHINAVDTLNDRGIGQIWLVTVRAIKIGNSDPAPLFLVAAKPTDVERRIESTGYGEDGQKKLGFLRDLCDQAQNEEIGSPVAHLSPSPTGVLDTRAEKQMLFYRVGVNRRTSWFAIVNRTGHWVRALDELTKNRQQIDNKFADAQLPNSLDWPETATDGRWRIRYEVDGNYQDPSEAKMRELNRAAAKMKEVFAPYLNDLHPSLGACAAENHESGGRSLRARIRRSILWEEVAGPGPRGGHRGGARMVSGFRWPVTVLRDRCLKLV